MDNDFYTVKEAAEKLGCTEQTVLNYVSSKKLIGKKVFRKWRISKKSVNGLLESFKF